ncbi:MAG: V-type ATPase subunit [Clostridia bacterium]|nr:V-type ATPase subunit [Clostridia bacterium]
MINPIYANARAKSLEKFLLGKEKYQRMIDCDSADEAIKILSEVNFGGGVLISSPAEFENLIDAEEDKLFEFIKTGCPFDDLKNFILLKNDFRNAEAYVRAKYLKIDGDTMTVKDGLFAKNDLKDKIFADDYGGLPDSLSKALLQADVEFVEKRASGESINNLFSKALFAELKQVTLKDKYLKDIFSTNADCINVSIAFRTRDYSVAKTAFVDGGTLSDSQLRILCEEPFESLKEKIKGFKHSDYLNVAIESACKHAPLSEFERLYQSYQVSLLKKDRFINEGVAPFALYCFYKLADLANVRIIMTGLINKLDKAQIKDRLRDGYEG